MEMRSMDQRSTSQQRSRTNRTRMTGPVTGQGGERPRLRAVAGDGEPGSAVQFADAAQTLVRATQALGLVAPSFRFPPRVPHAARTLRRRRGRCVVSVVVRGRPWVAVQADMIEGVVAANRLTGADADRARTALWNALVDQSSAAA